VETRFLWRVEFVVTRDGSLSSESAYVGTDSKSVKDIEDYIISHIDSYELFEYIKNIEFLGELLL
jgi:hypothetical protein